MDVGTLPTTKPGQCSFVIESVVDIFTSLILAIIGLIVGFGEGAVVMIKGIAQFVLAHWVHRTDTTSK